MGFEFYKKSYNGTRYTISKLIDDSRINQIKLFKRSKDSIPVNLYNGNRKIDSNKIANILANEELKINNYMQRIINLYDNKKKRNATIIEFEDLEKFRKEYFSQNERTI